MDVLTLWAQMWVFQLLCTLENLLWQPYLLKTEGKGVNVQNICIYNTQSHPTRLKSFQFQKWNFSICMKGGGMRDRSNSPDVRLLCQKANVTCVNAAVSSRCVTASLCAIIRLLRAINCGNFSMIATRKAGGRCNCLSSNSISKLDQTQTAF